MSDLLLNTDNAELVVRAIEENTAEFLLAMGKAGGGEERRSESIMWTIGGSPIDYHNAVVHANLSPENADSTIREVIERLKAYNVPGTWHLGPSMQPADLGARLEAYGFVNEGGEPGMAAYLPALNETNSAPDNLIIDRVRDERGLQAWSDTLASGFGEGLLEANWVASVYQTIGVGDDVPWRHYIGWLDGEPVATTSMFLGAGVAGIYFVMTVPHGRRKGIGGAITLAALRDARKMGYQVGILGASDAGFPVYERLGFRQYCDLSMYSWRSEK